MLFDSISTNKISFGHTQTRYSISALLLQCLVIATILASAMGYSTVSQTELTKLTKLTNMINPAFGNTQSVLECDFCQFVVNEAENYLQSNKTVNEIQYELDSVCKKFTFDRICEALVNAYLPQVIQMLEKKETPNTVCQQIGICSTVESISYHKLNLNDTSICIYVVSLAEKLLESDVGEKYVETQLEKACGLLPIHLVESCDGLVTSYYPTFVKYLESKFTPEDICHLPYRTD